LPEELGREKSYLAVTRGPASHDQLAQTGPREREGRNAVDRSQQSDAVRVRMCGGPNGGNVWYGLVCARNPFACALSGPLTP